VIDSQFEHPPSIILGERQLKVREAILATAIAVASSTDATAASELRHPARLSAIDCPRTGPYRACLEIPFKVGEADSTPDSAVVIRTDTTDDAITISLTGRLAGGPTRAYTLRRQGEREPSDLSPSMAYVGRSSGNRPLILTDAGPLEVLSSGFDVTWENATSREIVVADTNRNIATRYIGVIPDPIYETNGEELRVWARAGERCISLPVERPGRLIERKSGCPKVTAQLVPADVSLDRLAVFMPELKGFQVQTPGWPILGEGVMVEVYSVAGTHALVVQIICGDCD
jgi:hypothetical protein